ncbi:ChbG/HpnK family deacetylase [Lacticaseibacillus suihuaensis]
MSRLLLEGDDFGLTPAVSATLLALLAAGQLTATNCMPTMPEFPAAAAAAKAAGITAMGIHFILDRHRPASDPATIPSLVDARGLLLPWAQVQAKAAAGSLVPAEVQKELLAQLRLARQAGLAIDHITTHHAFVNASPMLAATVATIARTERLPMRNNFAAPLQGIAMPDHHANLAHDAGAAAALMATIAALPATATLEVVCHPGRVTPALLERSSLTTGREADARVLQSPALAALIAAQPGLTLIGWAAVTA